MGRKTWVFRTNIFLVVFLWFLVCLCSSTDTITFNQPLKDGDLLISNDSSYALGFFTPGNSIGKRYVGLWYLKIPEKVVVWVANRDSPVNGTSGILFIDTTGNLVIQDKETGTSVWNTTLSNSFEPTRTRDYSAQLQNTGNLVLYHDPEKRVDKWQSFDYPSNTIIASMKLGVGKNKSLNWFLRSWKSPDDPGTGEYTVGVDLTGKPQAFLYKNSSRVWRIGPWNGIRWSGVPQMTPEITPYTFTENDDEFSEKYWIRDPWSVYTIVMLNDSGTVNKIMWKGNGEKKWAGVWYFPNDDCDHYGHCGAFGICGQAGFSCRCVPGFKPKSNQEWRQGCWRNQTELCRNGEGFLKVEDMKIPDTEMAAVNTTIGLEECQELCLSNCSCTAYASANISNGGTGCITWYGDLIDMREFTDGGQDMYVRVSASDLGQLVKKSKEHHGKRPILSVILPIAAVILVLYCSITSNIRKALIIVGKKPARNTSLQLGKYMEEAGQADVLAFDLNTIRAATNNFSPDNKLGEGGFGSVYKGILQNGQFVAIKRLSRTSQQGVQEFKNEVKLIAKLQHRNLVRLLGCCIQQGEKMLVYEYLTNKSLDSFIFDNRQGMLLDWKKRFEIILGIAQGLLYLHQDSRLRIVHRDLKASNVLLDDSMNPKISDFGMVRLFEEEQVEANTNRVVGTYGYMSPEYAMGGRFSVKSDVYSFGVLLLEMVSGKKNKHKYKETSLNLIGDVWDFWNEERALEIVDPLSLGELYDNQEVLRCIHVGLLCVQLYPNDRPTMSEVIFMLSKDTKLPRPNPPGFLLNQGRNQSINTMSITELVGR